MATMTPVPAEIAGDPVNRMTDRLVRDSVAEALEEGVCPGFLSYRKSRRERRHWRECGNPVSAGRKAGGKVQCLSCERDDVKARATEDRDEATRQEIAVAVAPAIEDLRRQYPIAYEGRAWMAGLIGALRAMEPRSVPWNVKLLIFLGEDGS